MTPRLDRVGTDREDVARGHRAHTVEQRLLPVPEAFEKEVGQPVHVRLPRDLRVDEDRFDEAVDAAEIDWLESFTAEAPALLGFLDFTIASNRQDAALTKADFDERFKSALERLGLGFTAIPSDVLNELFFRAVDDRKRKSAFDAYREVLQGDRFDDTLHFIQEELLRLKLFSGVLGWPGKTAPPHQLSEWTGIWIGSLRDLVGRIEAQLSSGEEFLVQQHRWLSSGRTKIESHLLLSANSWITKLIAEKVLSITNFEMLVAYAHASDLVSLDESAESSDVVKGMQARISRAPNSKKYVESLALFFQMGINDLKTK